MAWNIRFHCSTFHLSSYWRISVSPTKYKTKRDEEEHWYLARRSLSWVSRYFFCLIPPYQLSLLFVDPTKFSTLYSRQKCWDTSPLCGRVSLSSSPPPYLQYNVELYPPTLAIILQLCFRGCRVRIIEQGALKFTKLDTELPVLVVLRTFNRHFMLTSQNVLSSWWFDT